ncbi:EVE domain-containing protein [Methanoregula sp. UBA64]|jgi:hypothetical protein|uniref:EVE domain-containing protein n=1 Tax=Methanoregula sp. UBA64 TaxID=1915554 RepID=UPI0025FDA7EF|nr:EVE domain-containing protein [Methanoregula sp. UBA64]
MKPQRYWIVVASREHVMLGVTGGFAQANHGKRSGLSRMHAGDGIIYYSPKVSFGKNEPLHAFTALGTVADEEIVQVEMTPDFVPFRRKVDYLYTGEITIEPLVADLGFIRNKKSWGYVFRFGLLEIPQPDFAVLLRAFEKSGTRLPSA